MTGGVSPPFGGFLPIEWGTIPRADAAWLGECRLFEAWAGAERVRVISGTFRVQTLESCSRRHLNNFSSCLHGRRTLGSIEIKKRGQSI